MKKVSSLSEFFLGYIYIVPLQEKIVDPEKFFKTKHVRYCSRLVQRGLVYILEDYEESMEAEEIQKIVNGLEFSKMVLEKKPKKPVEEVKIDMNLFYTFKEILTMIPMTKEPLRKFLIKNNVPSVLIARSKYYDKTTINVLAKELEERRKEKPPEWKDTNRW